MGASRELVLFTVLMGLALLGAASPTEPSSVAQIAPSAQPSATTAPAGFTLTKPTTRLLDASSPKPRPTRFTEPDRFIPPGLLVQKELSKQGRLGRARSGTLLYQVATPGPNVSFVPYVEKFHVVPPPHGYDARTGVTTPKPAAKVGPLAPGAPPREMTLSVEKTFPADGGAYINPPDMQIAVGEKHIVQVNNTKLTVWDKATTAQVKSVDLTTVFNVPDPFRIGDPWIVYDAIYHRWVLSVMAFVEETNESYIALAISSERDPLLPWTFRDLKFRDDKATLRDQPKLGMSDDKLLIAWDEYGTDKAQTDPQPLYYGGNWLALSKAALFGGTGDVIGTPANLTPDACLTNPIPARNQSPNRRGFILAAVRPDLGAACNGPIPLPSPYTSNVIRVLTIDGIPPNVQLVQQAYVRVEPFSAPANPDQRGSTQKLYAGDTRILSAIWQFDHLFTGSNDACKAVLNCFRFLQLSTSPDPLRTPRPTQDYDVGVVGRYLMYPSIAVDPSSRIIAVVSQVDSGYLGAAVFSRLAGHSDWGITTINRSTTAIECPQPSPWPSDVTRIGDYAGADRDPLAPNTIWLATGVPPAQSQGHVAGGQAYECPQGSIIGKFTFK